MSLAVTLSFALTFLRRARARLIDVSALLPSFSRYQWVGRFATKRERDAAVAEARIKLAHQSDVSSLTCREWANKWLVRYERDHKLSSLDTARSALRPFCKNFGERPLGEVTRLEAMEWSELVAAGRVPVVITMFNAAVDAELIDRNPFRGLSGAAVAAQTSTRRPPRRWTGCWRPATPTAATRHRCARC